MTQPVADDSAKRSHSFRRRLISLAVMALVNLLPIFGFIFSDWNLYELMTLYWAENVIIGVFTVLKMLSVETDSPADDYEILTAVPAFLAYFLLCFGQAMMIQMMFQILPPLSPEETWLEGWHRISGFFNFAFVQLKWVVLAMALNHGFAFVYDYNLGGERYRTTLRKLWFLPGVRLMVMMVIIMAAAWQLGARVSPMPLFMALVALKIVLEWLFDGIRRSATAEPVECERRERGKI